MAETQIYFCNGIVSVTWDAKFKLTLYFGTMLNIFFPLRLKSKINTILNKSLRLIETIQMKLYTMNLFVH